MKKLKEQIDVLSSSLCGTQSIVRQLQSQNSELKKEINKLKYRRLETLVPGDKIKVSFGGEIATAKVVSNFKEKQIMHIKIKIGWFIWLNENIEYDSHRFDLVR